MKRRSVLPLFIMLAVLTIFLLSGCNSDKPTETKEDSKVLYTCGMHPNVIQEGPGLCPICKMELVPLSSEQARVEQADEDHDEHAGESVAMTSEGHGGNARERKIKYWVAPMDPTYISDKPGKSPMGMDLIPVYEDEEVPEPSGKGVSIDPVTVQNMGVRVAHAHRGDMVRTIRAIGEVGIAEEALGVVNLRYSGWIEKIHVDETGSYVKKGDTLFSIYSPELVQAQEEYLQAVRSSGAKSPLARSARTRLELAAGGSWLAKAVRKSGRPLRTVDVPSPQDGYILHKNVVLGSKVNAGEDLYRIGSLDKIWVNVEVYEFDAPWIEVGQSARMEVSFQQGRIFEGKVGYVYPTLDEKTRTLRARLEFENPGLRLKPGMFATVWIDAQIKSNVLMIPTEAILHSGERQMVFVAKGGGKYEPREIVTGLVGNGHVTEVLSGLEEHEAVVTSGQFLLDSESQLQEAVAKLLEARLEAKQKKQASVDRDHGDHEEAHDQDDRESETYWTCPMHPQIVQDGPGQCPICKMDLVEKRK